MWRRGSRRTADRRTDRGDRPTAPPRTASRRRRRPCRPARSAPARARRESRRRRARPGRRRARSSARRPPASRSSSGMVWPGVSMSYGDRVTAQAARLVSGERNRRQLEALAHERGRSPPRARARTRRRPCRLRNGASSSSASRASDAARRVVERRARLLQQLGVEGRQPLDQRLPRLAAQAAAPSRAPRRAPPTRDRSARRTPAPSDPSRARRVSRSTTRSRCAGSD